MDNVVHLTVEPLLLFLQQDYVTQEHRVVFLEQVLGLGLVQD